MFRRKWWVGCVLLLVLLASCRPHGVLSRKEMASLLFELHLNDAALAVADSATKATWAKGLTPEQFKDLSYHSILRKYGLSQADFDASVTWYSKHLNLYNKVYKDVESLISVWRTEVAMKRDDSAEMGNKKPNWIQTYWRMGLIDRHAFQGLFVYSKDSVRRFARTLYFSTVNATSGVVWNMFPNTSAVALSDSLNAVDSLNKSLQIGGQASSVSGTPNSTHQPIVSPRKEPEMTTGGHFTNFEAVPVGRPNSKKMQKEKPADEKIRDRFKSRVQKPSEK